MSYHGRMMNIPHGARKIASVLEYKMGHRDARHAAAEIAAEADAWIEGEAARTAEAVKQARRDALEEAAEALDVMTEKLRKRAEALEARVAELEQQNAALAHVQSCDMNDIVSLGIDRDAIAARLADAESALWRVLPNTHTVECGLPLSRPADPFEGPGETYRAAYERVTARLAALLGTNANGQVARTDEI